MAIPGPPVSGPATAGQRGAGADWMLIDGSSLIFRAFFGVPRTVRAPSGMLNNGIRGFLDLLARLVTDRRPRRVLIASDEDWRPAWRVALIPGYKAHRVAEPVPPDLEPQIPRAWEVMAAIGIPVLGARDYEAEDVIATVAARVEGTVEVVSGDRDLFGLVRDPRVWVLYPAGKGQWQYIDEAAIEARYDVPGRAYSDFAALRGDPSDGLPGLPGVGPKSAASLLRRHGDAAGVMAAGRLSEAQAAYLRAALEVVRPVETIDLDIPDRLLPTQPADPAGVERLKLELGLGGAIDRLLKALDAAR